MEHKSTTVSVIIPCYNGERFIAEAVESALGQTYGDIEVIVVDDGSVDGSEDVLRPFLADGRVKFLKHERNRGIPAARNTGIRASRGGFIAFLDQDDVWFSHKLERQIPAFENERIGLVFSDMFYECEDVGVRTADQCEMIPAEVNSMPEQEVLTGLFLCNFVPTLTVVMPKRVMDEVGELDETIKGGSDDHELFLRVAGRYRLHHIAAPLAVKRMHGENYAVTPRLKNDQFYITEKMVGLFPELRAVRKKKLSGIYESLGYHYCGEGEFRRAVGYYMKALREAPSDITNWVKLLGVVVGLVAGQRAQVAYFKAGRRAREKAYKALGCGEDKGIRTRTGNGL